MSDHFVARFRGDFPKFERRSSSAPSNSPKLLGSPLRRLSLLREWQENNLLMLHTPSDSILISLMVSKIYITVLLISVRYWHMLCRDICSLGYLPSRQSAMKTETDRD